HRADAVGVALVEQPCTGELEHATRLTETRSQCDDMALRATTEWRSPERSRGLGRAHRRSAHGDDRAAFLGGLAGLTHVLGDAHRLFDERFDDLMFRHGLDHFALDEDLALAITGS